MVQIHPTAEIKIMGKVTAPNPFPCATPLLFIYCSFIFLKYYPIFVTSIVTNYCTNGSKTFSFISIKHFFTIITFLNISRLVFAFVMNYCMILSSYLSLSLALLALPLPQVPLVPKTAHMAPHQICLNGEVCGLQLPF